MHMQLIQKKSYEKLLNDYQEKFREVNRLNAALEHLISRTTGRDDEEFIKKFKQDLLNKMREEG